MLILRPEEIRQLPERHALVVAENTRPILARLRRCIDGKPGQHLLARQREARAQLTTGASDWDAARTDAALVVARERGLIDE